jgi:hypothetical protein
MAAKKNKKKNQPEAEPMPSLIFHDGTLDEASPSPTPNADLVEKALNEKSPRPPSLNHLSKYNNSAYRLMWLGVISIALVVCAMWSWSIYSQLSLVNWSVSEEKNFIETTKKSWREAFIDARGKNTEEQLIEIKENLSKLLSGASASSSISTSTENASSTP